MRILRFYVAWNVLLAMLVVLLGVFCLDLIFRVIAESTYTTDKYTVINAAVYEVMRTPAKLYTFIPMVGLVGCLTGLGALANNSELVVMRAIGVSTFRLLGIALIPAFLLMAGAMALGEYVAPKTSQMAEMYRAQAFGYERDLSKKGVWVREKDVFLQITAVHASGMIYGVNMFVFDGQQLHEIVQAKQAVFNQDHWLLEDVQQTIFNHAPDEKAIDVIKLEQYRWFSDLTPNLLSAAAISPDDMQMQQLWGYINYYKQQALNSTPYELAFWGKAFYPLIMLSLVLMGISFVFGPLRQVSMGYRVFIGVLAGIVLKTIQDALGPISIVYGFSPMYAMLVPALICTLVGLGILARVK